MIKHQGSCHCKAVTFEVEATEIIYASKCNCSICNATGFIHLIVKKDAFTLLSGKDDITTYTFNTHTAKHTFCKHCGIKSFYYPRSHPEGISVNVNCLDTSTIQSVKISQFDGQNWESNINQLLNDMT